MTSSMSGRSAAPSLIDASAICACASANCAAAVLRLQLSTSRAELAHALVDEVVLLPHAVEVVEEELDGAGAAAAAECFRKHGRLLVGGLSRVDEMVVEVLQGRQQALVAHVVRELELGHVDALERLLRLSGGRFHEGDRHVESGGGVGGRHAVVGHGRHRGADVLER